MVVSAKQPVDDLAGATGRLGRLSVRQYHRMIETGILAEDDPFELLEGLLVVKMTHAPRHDFLVTRLQRLLTQALGEAWYVRGQCAVTTRDSEPEPDIMIAVGPEEQYEARHPGPAEVRLVAEISWSRLALDGQLKGRIYARARIPVYWIVNVDEQMIEVYTDPRGGRQPAYRERRDYRPGENVPVTLDGTVVAELPVDQLVTKTKGR